MRQLLCIQLYILLNFPSLSKMRLNVIFHTRLSVPSDIDHPPGIKKRRSVANDIHIMILTSSHSSYV